MTLARGVDKTFTALAEDVTAKQRQGLGQLGVFFLQLVVVRRGLIEHAFELIDTALSVFGLLLSDLGLLLSDLGLLPQLDRCGGAGLRATAGNRSDRQGVAWHDAHNMRYTRTLMLFQCELR